MYHQVRECAYTVSYDSSRKLLLILRVETFGPQYTACSFTDIQNRCLIHWHHAIPLSHQVEDGEDDVYISLAFGKLTCISFFKGVCVCVYMI